MGELVLVAQKDNVLYIIEVKGRSNSAAYGGALNALSSRQVARIIICALAFACKHCLEMMPIELLYAACELGRDGRVEEMQLLPIF